MASVNVLQHLLEKKGFTSVVISFNSSHQSNECSFHATTPFSRKTTLHTTFLNLCRVLLDNTKYHVVSKEWIPLTPQECVETEKCLLLCLLHKDALKLQENLHKIFFQDPLLSQQNLLLCTPNTTIGVMDLILYHQFHHVNDNKLLEPLKIWLKDFLRRVSLVSPQLLQRNPCAEFVPSSTFSCTPPTNFIRQIIQQDMMEGKHSTIITRFPPEPNGYLHLGHAKSICLNFTLAKDFKGRCHLRFDDTNPVKENIRYIQAIQEDILWLGFDYGEHLYYTSDYFPQLYQWAIELIEKNLAYVDHQTEEEIRKNRGDLLTPGINSPYRERSVQENLKLFEQMKNGEFPQGTCVLRAKIDMTHGNMLLRDPLLYRIRFHHHPRTQNQWCIYPIYDFAHGQSDSLERITHSICTLEFEDHRPLYEWFQEKLNIFRTRQIEFARLNCTYTVMSKRKLLYLVTEKKVNDWDDPRLPTLSGLRRRGYPPEALRHFCEKIGVAKRDTRIPYEYLEFCVTNVLHPIALRRNVVLDPLKVKITNFPPETVETLMYPNHPEHKHLGEREIHFCQEIYIDRKDFMIQPPPNYFRLCPHGEVRLRHGYWIKCHDYVCNAQGEVLELHCTYDPQTRQGTNPPDGRKVKGTLHWISAYDAVDMEVRLYDRLFTTPTPDTLSDDNDFNACINPDSLKIVYAKGEKCLAQSQHPYKCPSEPNYFQFERVGFFVPDYDSTKDHPIMNLTVPLTDSWAIQNQTDHKDAQHKLAEKNAREKATLERQKKKEARLAKLKV